MLLRLLPQVMLEEIAGKLDAQSLMAFGSMGPPFRQATTRFAKNLKLKIITSQMQEYLRLNGSVVNSLNLSNSISAPHILSEVITSCYNVTELRVVGTMLSCEEILASVAKLQKLQMLSISVSLPEDRSKTRRAKRRRDHQRLLKRGLAKLKKFYLEIVGNVQSFDFSVDFMNSCPVLETAHISVIVNGWRIDTGVSELNPERWSTLRTLIISLFDCCVPGDARFDGFVKRVFKHKLTQETLLEWMKETKYTYIYEDGNLNGISYGSGTPDRDSDLIQRAQVVRVPPGEGALQLPWGRPQKLRIIGTKGPSGAQMQSLFRTPHPWYSELVELDFTESHYFLVNVRDSHFRLIQLSPLLEAIAMPPCLLWSLDDTSTVDRFLRTPSHKKRRITELVVLDERLQQLRLKKFCLKGAPFSRCNACYNTVMTYSNAPDLSGLRYLEELIINKVNVHGSAYVRLANPTVRTAKLCLGPETCFDGLPDFLSRSTNLRNLKLDSCLLPLHSQHLWKSLADKKNVKQLCLGSRNTTVSQAYQEHPEYRRNIEIPISDAQVVDFFTSVDELIGRLETFHLHATVLIKFVNAPPLDLQLYIRERMGLVLNKNTGTIAERFVGREEESLVELMLLQKPPAFAGRSVCNPESFIGMIEPEAWTID